MDGALVLIVILLSLVLVVILRGIERLAGFVAGAFRSRTRHIKNVDQPRPLARS